MCLDAKPQLTTDVGYWAAAAAAVAAESRTTGSEDCCSSTRLSIGSENFYFLLLGLTPYVSTTDFVCEPATWVHSLDLARLLDNLYARFITADEEIIRQPMHTSRVT